VASDLLQRGEFRLLDVLANTMLSLFSLHFWKKLEAFDLICKFFVDI